MNNRIHIRNGLFGILVTLAYLAVGGVIGSIILPALVQSGVIPDAMSLWPLSLIILFGLQFLLCYTISRRCELKMRDQPQAGRSEV